MLWEPMLVPLASKMVRKEVCDLKGLVVLVEGHLQFEGRNQLHLEPLQHERRAPIPVHLEVLLPLVLKLL